MCWSFPRNSRNSATKWTSGRGNLRTSRNCEPVAEQVRIIRVPCGGKQFIPKEYLSQKMPQWGENALRFIKRHGLKYEFINSHYWDAGVAGQHLSEALDVPHVHTPHSLGMWKKRQMEERLSRRRGEVREAIQLQPNAFAESGCCTRTRIWSWPPRRNSSIC